MIPGAVPFLQFQYLPTARQFPQEWALLEPQLSKSWFDLASAVNARTIGIYETFQAVNGDRWFNPVAPADRRQSYRKVFPIGAIAAGVTSTTAHGIKGFTAFNRIYGTAQTAGDFRPVPYASATAVNNNIEIKVSLTDIIIINGAGAPNILGVLVVLEYFLN